MNTTFAVIKPDATEAKIEGAVLRRIEASGGLVVESKRKVLTMDEARFLYAEHSSKEHFEDLCRFMCSGEVILLKIIYGGQGGAVERLRGVVGAFSDNTSSIRGTFATSVRRNVIHASDSPESATRELSFFF